MGPVRRLTPGLLVGRWPMLHIAPAPGGMGPAVTFSCCSHRLPSPSLACELCDSVKGVKCLCWEGGATDALMPMVATTLPPRRSQQKGTRRFCVIL